MTIVEDFTNTLREALTEVEAAGLVEPAAAARRATVFRSHGEIDVDP